MFYDGKTYTIKRATKALTEAVKEFVAAAARGIDDPLERYEAMEAAMSSLPLIRFLTKHLIPDFDREVTADNRLALYRAIELRHSDPQRAEILDIRAARRWAAAQEEASHGDA